MILFKYHPCYLFILLISSGSILQSGEKDLKCSTEKDNKCGASLSATQQKWINFWKQSFDEIFPTDSFSLITKEMQQMRNLGKADLLFASRFLPQNILEIEGKIARASIGDRALSSARQRIQRALNSRTSREAKANYLVVFALVDCDSSALALGEPSALYKIVEKLTTKQTALATIKMRNILYKKMITEDYWPLISEAIRPALGRIYPDHDDLQLEAIT